MKKLLSSTLVLVLIGVAVVSLYDYQYNRSYYKKSFNNLSVKEQYRQLDCLSHNIYYEASNQSLAGKIAVGQVTINRVNSPKFGNDICKTVFAKNQFSWTSDKPKALIRINKEVYNDSREVAKKVLFEGERVNCVGNSTYYHTKAVNPPWSKSFTKTCVIEDHIFYKD